eukprot:2516447-Lingulodinium_polyedra.AAC.1
MSRPAKRRLHRRHGQTTSSSLRQFYLLASRPRTEMNGASSQIPGRTPTHGHAAPRPLTQGQ